MFNGWIRLLFCLSHPDTQKSPAQHIRVLGAQRVNACVDYARFALVGSPFGSLRAPKICQEQILSAEGDS